MKTKPEKSNRGRRPQNETEYIRKSREQIKQWEQDLKNKKNKIPKADYDSLYNKKTALQSRLRKKLEQRSAKSTLSSSEQNF